MAGRMEFSFNVPKTERVRTRERTRGGPFRILVLADLSGRDNRGLLEPGPALAARPTLQVDVDSFDTVLARLSPTLELGLPKGGQVSVTLTDLDHFHPDELYRRLELFQGLRDLRRRLGDPSTFAEAASELETNEPPASNTPPDAAEQAAPDESDGDMFSRLLGKEPSAQPQARAGRRGSFDIGNFIAGVVGPHVVPEPDPRAETYIAGVDAATTEQMRALLRHPALTGLEGTWRSLRHLITHLETDEDLTVHVVDVGRQELMADLAMLAENPAQSGLHHILVESTHVPGAQPWSVVVADGEFHLTGADISTLAALGAMGSRAGAPVLAAVSPQVVGARTVDELADPSTWAYPTEDAAGLWDAFRASPAAGWVGALLPRILQRLPHGADTDPIDAFAFEETESAGDGDSLVWGSAAFAAALLLGKSYREREWEMQPGDHQEVDDLPTYVFRRDDEPHLKAVAEVYLSESAATALLGRGVMPLMSYKDRPAARLLRFQNAAGKPGALPGRWG